MSKKRLLEFDILRGFAFLFIIVQHTIGGFSTRSNITQSDFLLSKFIFEIAKVATPAFVLLTGIGLFYSHRDSLDIKDFYIKKLKFLVLPYILFSIFILKSRDKLVMSDLTWTLLSGDAQYHLWYMAMIIRIYFYFPLIYLFFKYIVNKNKYFKSLFFFVFLYLEYYILNHYEILTYIKNILFKNPGDLQLRFVNISPLYYVFYLILGAYIINNYTKFKEVILKYKYIVITLYLLYLSRYYYLVICDSINNPLSFVKTSVLSDIIYRILSLLFFYLVSLFIYSKFKYISKAIIFISKYSFPAYLIHVYYLNEYSCSMLITNDIGCFIKLFFLVLTKSILVCFVLSFLPFSKYFLGCKTKINKDKILNLFYTLKGKTLIKNK